MTSVVEFDFEAAATDLLLALGRVRDDQLDLPTPCAEWTVRELLTHACALAPAFTRVAHHQGPMDEPTALAPNWRDAIVGDLDALVAAWRDPSAWTGEAQVAGLTMPSSGWAAVALDELVVHAWDLAVATGQPAADPNADLGVVERFVDGLTAPGSPTVEGLWGEPRTPPADADRFQTILARTGRDPRWQPQPHVPLAVFVGDWSAQGQVYNGTADDPHGGASPWRSVHSARWHSGNFFVVQDERANGPFDTLSLMGWDAQRQTYFGRSIENHGFTREYLVDNDGDAWTFTGEHERATHEFSSDGRTQTIHWEWKRNGQWLPLCDRVATRVA